MPRFQSEPDVARTPPHRPNLALDCIEVIPCREDREARKIVELHARSSLDSLKLWPPKSLFFSPSRRCMIAYAVANNTAVCLGDPVGPGTEIELTVREFLKLCSESGWGVAFYRASSEFLPIYTRLRLRKLKIGDDAVVDPSKFSLEGRSKRDIRSKARHFEELGMDVVEYEPPLSPGTLSQLRMVEEEWLNIPGRRERTFAVGYFDQDYLRSTTVLAAIDRNRKILAFINLLSTTSHEIAGDLMRRARDAPNGIMDFLLLRLIQYAGERGYSRVGLGLAPMTGFNVGESATLEERLVNGVLQNFNFCFRFRSLYQYKAKFATSWEPRYLIYKNLFQLPRIALALIHLSEIKGCDRKSTVDEETLTNSGQ